VAKRKCENCRGEIESTSVFCPNCGWKIKKRNIFLFSLLMIPLFFLVLEILMPAGYQLFNYGITLGKYGTQALAELFMVLVITIILFVSGNQYVFSEKKVGFFKSLYFGLPMLLFALYIFVFSVGDAVVDFNLANFVSLIILCFLVGIFEEFLCRAWLENEFIERFGSTKKGIIISILLSSFVFGAMHITNLLYTTQGVFETIVQVFQAMASGFLFGAIYYKTKNIWSSAFLHGFFDFALMLSSVNLIKDCTNLYPNVTSQVISGVSSLFIMSFYVFAGLFALSRKGGSKFIKKGNVLNIVSIVGFVLSICLLFSTSIVGSVIMGEVEQSVCYEFDKKNIKVGFDVVTSSRKTYKFTEGKYEYELYLNDNDELTLASNTNSLKIKFDGILRNYVLIENLEYVEIVLNYYDNAEDVIYYSKIFKESCRDSMKFLNNINDNFTRIDVPDLSYIGYTIFENNEIKYPYFYSTAGDELFLDSDSELYIIKTKNKSD
jgi:membrane protease YdiL (CAAX protease family)